MALQYDLPKIRKCVEGILGKDIANWAETNIKAVINFYTNNPVEFKSGQKAIWYEGILVQDFDYETFHDENDGMERVREWQEEYGPGIMWIEKPLNVCHEVLRFILGPTNTADFVIPRLSPRLNPSLASMKI